MKERQKGYNQVDYIEGDLTFELDDLLLMRRKKSNMDVKYTVKNGQKPNKKQMSEIEKAKTLPITSDDDCPVYSKEELQEMIRRTKELGKDRKKYGVSIRLDEESIEIAKAYGSGYTSLLAKIIYLGIRDPEILSKAVKQLEL